MGGDDGRKRSAHDNLQGRLMYSLARPFLFGFDAERAHGIGLASLEAAYRSGVGGLMARRPQPLPTKALGLVFPNPVGLAAGLDKNGAHIDALLALGFGFVEVGTVTPLAQPGNPKPRLFRIPAANALINRLGFNNDGLAAFIANVRQARFRARGGILGLNIGKNAATPIERAVDDYLLGLAGVYPHADYVAVNISSPNTQNLRALQSDAALDALLSALAARRAELADEHGKTVPMFLKIAPDLDTAQIEAIATIVARHRVDGVIATNTTLARDGVTGHANAGESGGLSGAPLARRSDMVIASLRGALGPRFPLIGVGGVMSAADARAKREAGADLVQIYTGFIYKGPALVTEAARALADT